MLTFFRKIRKALLASGSTRKYLLYALGEILLVMIGILLALQVNNWNEWRKDRAEEELFLKELKSDFEINRTLYEQEMSILVNWLARIDSTSKYIEQPIPDSINTNELLNWYYGASAPPFEPAEGALNEILNSGKLQILSNRQLRRYLSSWKNKVDIVRVHISKIQKFREDQIRPYMIQCCPQGAEYRNEHLKAFDDHRMHSNLQILKRMFLTQINGKRKPLKEVLDQVLVLIDAELEEIN